jgi:putative copper resistance protein D
VIVAAGLIASRFLHYAALMILFGAAGFPLYSYRDGTAPPDVEAWLRRTLLAAAIAALITGISWFAFATAGMAGNLGAMFDWTTLKLVVTTTDFGRIWLPRLGLLVLAAALLLQKNASANRRLLVLGAAAIALTSIADTGHAGADNGPNSTLHITADAVHLSAAAAWIGGLLALSFALASAPSRSAADRILMRFSGMGVIAVLLIVASGLVNSWILVGSVRNVFATAYGRWLLAKLVLFLVMAGLAGANRFWIMPGMARVADPSDWMARLRRHVIAEQAVGMLILAVVSVLGTLAPAVEG